jgi:hypothetical protein
MKKIFYFAVLFFCLGVCAFSQYLLFHVWSKIQRKYLSSSRSMSEMWEPHTHRLIILKFETDTLNNCIIHLQLRNGTLAFFWEIIDSRAWLSSDIVDTHSQMTHIDYIFHKLVSVYGIVHSEYRLENSLNTMMLCMLTVWKARPNFATLCIIGIVLLLMHQFWAKCIRKNSRDNDCKTFSNVLLSTLSTSMEDESLLESFCWTRETCSCIFVNNI